MEAGSETIGTRQGKGLEVRPEIFHIFDFAVPSYGFMLALSFLFGIWIAARRAQREDLDPNVILDLGIVIIIAAVIGSRLYYFLIHPERFPGGLLTAFNPFHSNGTSGGGLVFNGGLIGGILAIFIYMRVRRLSFPQYADTLAPSIALGVFLTRIGCFLNGCCYGKGWDGLLAVSFPPTSPPGLFQKEINASGLHPSQLYESFGGLVILVVLLTAGRRWKRWDGLQFYMVILSYAVLRFFVEYTRHFEPGEMIGPFTHNQMVCVVLFVAFGFLALRSLNRSGIVGSTMD